MINRLSLNLATSSRKQFRDLQTTRPSFKPPDNSSLGRTHLLKSWEKIFHLSESRKLLLDFRHLCAGCQLNNGWVRTRGDLVNSTTALLIARGLYQPRFKEVGRKHPVTIGRGRERNPWKRFQWTANTFTTKVSHV